MTVISTMLESNSGTPMQQFYAGKNVLVTGEILAIGSILKITNFTNFIVEVGLKEMSQPL